MIRLLAVSHSAIIPGYRVLLNRIAGMANIEIHLVAPDSWIEANEEQSFSGDADIDSLLKLHVCRAITWGFKKRSHKNVTHIYPDTLKILKKVKPHIMYIVEEPYSIVTSSWIFAAHCLGFDPFIIFFSGQSIYKKFSFPFNILEKYVLRKAHLSFPVNRDVSSVLAQKGFFNSRVVPLGFDEKKFNNLQQNNFQHNKYNNCILKKNNKHIKDIKFFNIGFIGALTEQKGIDILIRAVENILENTREKLKKIELKLHITGTGPLKNIIETAQKKWPRNIIYNGFIPHNKIPFFIKKMDLIAVPSVDRPNVKEQLGRVIVEAMACGVPVIGSSSGEISRVISDNEMIFESGSVKSLEEKIIYFMLNPGVLVKKAELSIERSKVFSWENIAKVMVMHIRSAMWDNRKISF
jgi:glycosyltransferase involved in cell wall biosynthesis